jgi:hypothetical protein
MYWVQCYGSFLEVGSSLGKEVHIPPTTFGFGTLNPLNYEMVYLTPLTMQYRVIHPLQLVRAVIYP